MSDLGKAFTNIFGLAWALLQFAVMIGAVAGLFLSLIGSPFGWVFIPCALLFLLFTLFNLGPSRKG